MNVMILSSSTNQINDYYKSIARSISHYLADYGFDLVYGGCSTSMMGICYEEFAKKNREIYSFTTKKYVDDIKNLPEAKHYIKETTFDMKKAMFENSDIIVVLPGGIGTISELFAFVEENRSNDQNIPIIVYDEDSYYKLLWDQLTMMQKQNFVFNEIVDLITISHNRDEFIESIERVINEKGRRK